MHFGRTDSSEGKDLSLPPDAARTTKFLKLPRNTKTQVYIGCPIWAVRTWKGTLYPKGTQSSDYLRVYATRFNTVEINSTFYQLLDAARMTHWREQVPAEFRFCPKVYRGITEDLGALSLPNLIQTYCNSIRVLGNNLGLVFAQLPETFGPRQGNLLKRFLTLWPAEIPLSIEFRHPGWFKDHMLSDELVNFLYRSKAATVITDTPGRRDVLHLSLTQPKVLIRFQGQKLQPSDYVRMEQWTERIDFWSQHHLEEIYFFAHQPEENMIPETALWLAEHWQRKSALVH